MMEKNEKNKTSKKKKNKKNASKTATEAAVSIASTDSPASPQATPPSATDTKAFPVAVSGAGDTKAQEGTDKDVLSECGIQETETGADDRPQAVEEILLPRYAF